MSKKIILVLLSPIINKFDFCSEEKMHFIDSGKLNKLFLQKISGAVKENQLLNLFDIDHGEETNKIIKEQNGFGLILINYPHTEDQFKSLNQKLAKEGQKIKNIILINISSYELIVSIQNEYLICPICERIFKKEEVVKENKNFVCPNDSNFQFSLEKINKFNGQIISHYLRNSKELIENFLRENNFSSDIIQLTINKKEEIFSGEMQKNLLSIIRNI